MATLVTTTTIPTIELCDQKPITDVDLVFKSGWLKCTKCVISVSPMRGAGEAMEIDPQRLRRMTHAERAQFLSVCYASMTASAVRYSIRFTAG